MYYTFGYIKPDKIYLIINNKLSSSSQFFTNRMGVGTPLSKNI